MANEPERGDDPARASVYRIRIAGRLAPRFADRFGDLAIAPQANGDTLLTGPVADQAALHALLRKVRDLGMPLVSVVRVASVAERPPQRPRTHEDRKEEPCA